MTRTIQELVTEATLSSDPVIRKLGEVLDDLAYSLPTDDDLSSLYSYRNHVEYTDDLERWKGEKTNEIESLSDEVIDLRDQVRELTTEVRCLKFSKSDDARELFDSALAAKNYSLSEQLQASQNECRRLRESNEGLREERDDALSKLKMWTALTKEY